jgi:hypothetical protein
MIGIDGTVRVHVLTRHLCTYVYAPHRARNPSGATLLRTDRERERERENKVAGRARRWSRSIPSPRHLEQLRVSSMPLAHTHQYVTLIVNSCEMRDASSSSSCFPYTTSRERRTRHGDAPSEHRLFIYYLLGAPCAHFALLDGPPPALPKQ